MKKIILIMLLANNVSAKQIHVSTTGNNITGTGTSTNPYASLIKAVSVSVASDTIRIHAGTYNSTTECALPAGVNILGDDSSNTILNSTEPAFFGATIRMTSATANALGQFITGIKINCGLTTKQAIWSSRRSNIIIYKCSFNNSYRYGIVFDNNDAGYSTGNIIRDNQLNNCSGDSLSVPLEYRFSLGSIGISKQTGMLIYGNVIRENFGRFGYGIKFSQSGNNRGLKIYNNDITCAANINHPTISSWNFTIELWNTEGGLEIYNNRLRGSLDLGGGSTIKGTYPFAANIYNNVMGWDTLTTKEETGFTLEGDFTDIYFHDNTVKNVSVGMTVNSDHATTQKRLYVNKNVFQNIGQISGNFKGWGIKFGSNNNSAKYDSIFIDNNTIVSNTVCTRMWGILLTPKGITTNFYIRNNIINNFRGPIYDTTISAATVDKLFIQNNIFFQNQLYNTPYFASTVAVTNNTTAGNLTSNPLLVSVTDYHLQPGSPAIGTALNVGYGTDRGALHLFGARFAIESPSVKNKPGSAILYPNPAKDMLYINDKEENIDKNKYSIIDVEGKVIPCKWSSNNCLNVSGLSSGTYFLIIGSGNQKKTIKFIK